MTYSDLNIDQNVHSCDLILQNPGKWDDCMVQMARNLLTEVKLDLEGGDEDCTTRWEIDLRNRLRSRVDVLLGVPGATKPAKRLSKEEQKNLAAFLLAEALQLRYKA